VIEGVEKCRVLQFGGILQCACRAIISASAELFVLSFKTTNAIDLYLHFETVFANINAAAMVVVIC